MSRTRKDEPEFVQKLKHGIVIHDENCTRRSQFYNQNRTLHFDAIFYAHEVAKIEAFEEKLAEENAEFSVSEKKGYLFTFTGDDQHWWNRIANPPHYAVTLFKEFVDFGRESVEAEAIGVNQYARKTDSDLLFPSSYARTNKTNVFKIYSVDVDLGRFKNQSNREGVYTTQCCEPVLPAKMKKSRRDCSCCFTDNESFESKTNLRSSLISTAKAFNSNDFDVEDEIIEHHNIQHRSSRV